MSHVTTDDGMAEKRTNNEFLFSILRSSAKSVTNEEVEHDKSR